MTLKDFVNIKMASAEKVANAEGYPLQLNDCKKHKKMRQLEVYGNSYQDGTPSPENPIEVQHVGDLVTDENDANYGKYKIPVIQRGINLLPENLFTKSSTVCNITVDYEGNGIFYLHGEYENTTGSNISANNWVFERLSLPLDLKSSYTLHTEVISGSCTHNVIPYVGTRNVVSSNKINWVNTTIKPNNCEPGTLVSKTVLGGHGVNSESIGIAAFWFYWNIQAGTMITVNMRIRVWLTKSSTRLPYEPYVEPVTTNIFLDEPLRSIDTIYKDSIDFKNKKIHRLLHEYYLDGSHTITQYTNACVMHTNGAICINLLNREGRNGLSNRFKHVGNKYNGEEPYVNLANATGSAVQISYFRLIPDVTDAATLKQWLTENPVTYVAQLTTPKEEPLGIELPKLNARTTIFEVGTSLAPNNLSGKYIKR